MSPSNLIFKGTYYHFHEIITEIYLRIFFI